MTERTQHHQFSSRLDVEWRRLRHDRRSITLVRSRADAADQALATIGDLDQLLALTHRANGALGNARLLALVSWAQDDRADGWQLAGRIVIQRLLPGLIASAARHRHACGDADPAEVAVGASWIAIRRLDIERRTDHIAATLISDAVYTAFRQPTRRRSADEEPTEPTTFDERGATQREHPFEELAAVIGEARRAGVPAADLELIRELVAGGSAAVVASRRNVTARTVRNHRSRALERIRLAVAA